MATLTLSGTDITLLGGIPFSNDYKHTRWFSNLSSQQSYFNARSKIHVESQANFQKIEGHQFIAVNKSIDELWGTNYLMFRNTSYNNKWFYAFVTKLEYVQRNTTYVHFEIDVLQTWLFELTFKPSFIAREHCQLTYGDGSPVVNTIDEGLYYGADYDIVESKNIRPFGDNFFLVVVMKQTVHLADNKISPSINGIPQQLTYYVHPFKVDGENCNVRVDNSGVLLSSINSFLTALSQDTNAVNNIVNMYITDSIGGGVAYGSDSDYLNFFGVYFETVGFGGVYTLHAKKMRYDQTTIDVGSKYRNFSVSTQYAGESKLKMFPYYFHVLTDMKGNQITVKPEYINGNELILFCMGSMGIANKVAYGVENYCMNDGSIVDIATKLNNAIINNSPNDVPVVSDYLSAFLQGNRNTIENKQKQISFKSDMAYVQGMADLTSSATNFSVTQPFKSIGDVVQTGVKVYKGTKMAQLEMQGLQAKMGDISHIPPSLNQLGGNSYFDYGNGDVISGVYLITKQIKPEYQNKIGAYFNMYGYKVNDVKLPNLHTRENWNYVQTVNCIITGSFNNEDLYEIKSIFDNGITLWHTDDIGNYSLSNGVI